MPPIARPRLRHRNRLIVPICLLASTCRLGRVVEPVNDEHRLKSQFELDVVADTLEILGLSLTANSTGTLLETTVAECRGCVRIEIWVRQKMSWLLSNSPAAMCHVSVVVQLSPQHSISAMISSSRLTQPTMQLVPAYPSRHGLSHTSVECLTRRTPTLTSIMQRYVDVEYGKTHSISKMRD